MAKGNFRNSIVSHTTYFQYIRIRMLCSERCLPSSMLPVITQRSLSLWLSLLPLSVMKCIVYYWRTKLSLSCIVSILPTTVPGMNSVKVSKWLYAWMNKWVSGCTDEWMNMFNWTSSFVLSYFMFIIYGLNLDRTKPQSTMFVSLGCNKKNIPNTVWLKPEKVESESSDWESCSVVSSSLRSHGL